MKTIHSFILRCTPLLVGVFISLAGLPSARAAVMDGDAANRPDHNFIEKATKSGWEEVAISQIAVERTSNLEVKKYAQMMVNDHTAANEVLSGIATAQRVKLPAKEAAPSKWTQKSGKSFDEDYLEKMISDHEDAVKLFGKEATDGKDEVTMAFARKTLPTLQHHLEQAKDLKKMLK